MKAWKKEWAKRQTAFKKRMAAYRTKVAAVNAYNKLPRRIPNARTTYYEDLGHGIHIDLYEEPRIPSGGVWWVKNPVVDGVTVHKILTKRASRPRGPRRELPPRPKFKAPPKIQDPVALHHGKLTGLQTRLGTLAAELDVGKLGPEFLPVADEIRNGIEVLQTEVDLTLKGCDEAVRRDPMIGCVAVPKKFRGVDVTGVHEAVQVVRESLVDAAQTHGVDLSELTWASTPP